MRTDVKRREIWEWSDHTHRDKVAPPTLKVSRFFGVLSFIQASLVRAWYICEVPLESSYAVAISEENNASKVK
jgi:hypothetical protein